MISQEKTYNKVMKLAITICATENYTYAMKDQAVRVQAALRYANIENPVIILVTDKSGKMGPIFDLYNQLIPGGNIILKDLEGLTEGENYKTNSQLLISRMRTAAFNEARIENVDFCLSLDSDVLPAINGIQAALDMLAFDKGYYSVACMMYTSQGGGPWLCGRGTTQEQILPDFYENERDIPQRYLDFKAKYEEQLPKSTTKEEVEKIHKKLGWIRKRFGKYNPKYNVFEANAKGWRKRGWFDNAYPAIGKGAAVPSDWCGFGATMLSRKALAHANFDGYQGQGTEDLYVCFTKWKPNDIRIVAISHVVCDHVVRDRKEKGKYIHVQGYHEETGECEGHLRQRWLPFTEQA